MKQKIWTLPNALSGLRILLVPVLLALAWQGQREWFLICLAVSLVSDGLDGYFARLLHQESDLGVKLDSWGDLLTYGAMVFGLYLAWPAIFQREFWFLVVGVSFYLLPTVLSLFKFGELPTHHTWAAKLSAVLIAPAYYLLTLADHALLFRVVILFHVWVAIEGVLIVLILRRNRYNVPTFIHARNLSRRAKARFEKIRERRDSRREARYGADLRKGRERRDNDNSG